MSLSLAYQMYQMPVTGCISQIYFGHMFTLINQGSKHYIMHPPLFFFTLNSRSQQKAKAKQFLILVYRFLSTAKSRDREIFMHDENLHCSQKRDSNNKILIAKKEILSLIPNCYCTHLSLFLMKWNHKGDSDWQIPPTQWLMLLQCVASPSWVLPVVYLRRHSQKDFKMPLIL